MWAASALALICLVVPVSTSCQNVVPGCSHGSTPAPTAVIVGSDFLEVQHTRCFGPCPVYTARLYADGRLLWHGVEDVSKVGDATAMLNPIQAHDLLDHVRKNGFWNLCEVYYPHATDGPTHITSLSMGGQIKTVRNQEPSDAPPWLLEVGFEFQALTAMQQWIGKKQ